MVHRPGTIINISGNNPIDDPQYRYQMPVVYGKIEGRGNGIKTVIPNIIDVASSLNRSPSEVNKFFGCELGAQTSYSEDTDKAIVNGAHSDDVLQGLIHKYIQGFVLCPACGLPETEYKIKNECIWHRCKACGAKEMVDMGHKLCTFILGQYKKAKKDKSSKKDKEESKEKGEKKKKDDKEGKKSKDEKKEKKEKKSSKEKGQVEEAESSDELEAGVDDSAAFDQAVEEVKKYLRENDTTSPADLCDYVSNQQMSFALKAHQKIHMFMHASITPNFYKEKQIQKHAEVIKLLTQSNPIIERHLIGAVESLCVVKPKHFPVMIKLLFDEEALDEEVILAWASEGRTEFTVETVSEDIRVSLRNEAEPVIAWLQQSESEDEDESD